jgi:hypothetical protein
MDEEGKLLRPHLNKMRVVTMCFAIEILFVYFASNDEYSDFFSFVE